MYDTKFKTTLTDKAIHAPSRLSKQAILNYTNIRLTGYPFMNSCNSKRINLGYH